MEHWTQKLIDLGACSDAIEWARGYATLDEAWAACNCVDWMAWLAGRCSGDPESPARKVLVLALCEIVRGVLHMVPAGENRPRIAIETAEAWARGKVTISAMRAAAKGADAAARAANAASAVPLFPGNAISTNAAYAATARAATNAAYAAYATAAEAVFAAYAAADAAYVASKARAANFDTSTVFANIIRKHYPKPPELP